MNSLGRILAFAIIQITLLTVAYHIETLNVFEMAGSSNTDFGAFERKLKAEGLSDAFIKSFKNSYDALVAGSTGAILETSITPVPELPRLDDGADAIRSKVKANPELLKKTVVLKLNGGLGTSMGLDKAKSLLVAKGEDTFLDFIAKQVMHMRNEYKSNVRFMLMNSFSTSADTLEFLQKYPEIVNDSSVELLQNKAPKVDAETMKPAEWPQNPEKEWCPPGHGDLYAALTGSGHLDKLLSEGYLYMFVSNSDNLGATLDLDLLTYFAESEAPFLMECCERTENDKKGGHLAVRKEDKRLILRESAQCDKDDEAVFQDVNVHRYFNTNNLWIRLDKLKDVIIKNNGLIPLPMIKNSKTVDPQDGDSPAVFQLETAMGAAIECFDNAGAVVVPRTRFAPVKKCSDLLMLLSDAYKVTEDHRLVLTTGEAPVIDLDGKEFKLVQQLQASLRGKNIPSLVKCKRLKIKGPVDFQEGVVFEGEVEVVNNSGARRTLPSGTYAGQKIDLSDNPGLGPLDSETMKTKAFEGQKPGTSGLRQKTKTFMQQNYVENFVQSTFNSLNPNDIYGGTLVISGDGRYYNKEAIQIIVKMAVAAGVDRIWIGKDGLLSTPAVSAVIREREGGFVPFGAFILTASHNPGGLEEDFGLKYNCENGGPAPEKVTNQIYENTRTISKFQKATKFPDVDITKIGKTEIKSDDGTRTVTVEVFDSAEDHVALLKTIFDFGALKQLLARPDFSLVYDSMHGVQGPYARRVFVEELGASESCLLNAVPKEDFGGGHADPNLTYAKDLIKIMGVDKKGNPAQTEKTPPSFGAACDGDADRNMILGPNFFVSPSDSLAVIAANAHTIPFFAQGGGLKGVARSMPTSGAVDLVAKRLGFKCFETPTGWKFFGNLMDSKVVFGKEDYTPFICGEESFGTGSNHIREKDGMWAVLAWLNILAAKNPDPSQPFFGVEDIVREHWKTYGRNYYCRYDYEGVEKDKAMKMINHLAAQAGTPNFSMNNFTIKLLDEFSYTDPVDGSVSSNQGIRILFTDGSRVIFRLSGTGVAGATIRMYIEKYEPASGSLDAQALDALQPLIEAALAFSDLEKHTGRTEPTVIT